MRCPSGLPLLLALTTAAACTDARPSATTGPLPSGRASEAMTGAPARMTGEAVFFFIRGGPPAFPTLTAMSPPSTLLWDGRGHQPIIAPDGHQVTLGEWLTATGRAAVKCIGGGTHVVLHFANLLPDATYTVWQLTFKSPGFQGNPNTNRIGLGALGPNDGSANVFHTSASGEGELSAVTPAGPLSIQGSVGACGLDEYEIHFVAAYHINGQTYGGVPGPAGTFAEQIGFPFRGR